MSDMMVQPEGFTEALAIFQDASQRVPGYTAFLASQGITASAITTPEQLAKIPVVTKENYLRAFPLQDLFWDGTPTGSDIISTSSGSSGRPFFWPRGKLARTQGMDGYRDMYYSYFGAKKDEPTLLIIAFAMGSWIAGTYTFTASMALKDEEGCNITIATPGINKSEIVRILQEVAPMFPKVILAGYPPFIKDVLDEAERQGTNLPSLPLSLMFAGENFSETWRDYVLKKIGQDDNIYATATIYGTADAGIMGHENPFSIFSRRASLKNHDLFEELFPGATSVPSLVSYNPRYRYFEEDGTHLVFTCNNSLPLIRYQIGDEGFLIHGQEIADILRKHGVVIPSELEEFTDKHYLTVYGRSDVATTFYALDIFPENIRATLESNQYQHILTSKFVLSTENHPETQEQVLKLAIELKPDVGEDTISIDELQQSVVEGLRALNSEYGRLYQEIGDKAHPTISLLPHESPEFIIGIKHRWNKR
jgi:phenylacetate-CoA ligase